MGQVTAAEETSPPKEDKSSNQELFVEEPEQTESQQASTDALDAAAPEAQPEADFQPVVRSGSKKKKGKGKKGKNVDIWSEEPAEESKSTSSALDDKSAA